jgi:hypothetical protein
VVSIPGIQGPIAERIDGFLGFRATQVELAGGSGINGRWTSDLQVSREGTYGFELNSNGASSLTIDGKPVITNLGEGSPHAAGGSIDLRPGRHRAVITYSYQFGVGYLEAWWTPPGGQRELMISRAFRAPR